MGWYYLSCKVCSKKVIPVLNENSDDEEDDIPFAHTYFCLHLIVLDNTGNSKIILFDNLAFQLINLPCFELVGPKFEEIQEVGDLPLPIINLVGKTYLFKVAIEKENYLYKHDTYKVERIITNEEVIYEFDPYYVSTVIPVLNENSDDEEDDIPFAHTYYCVKCKVTNPKLVPRYKLHLIVLDNTGNSKLMLFDNLAVQLINLPCLDLAGSKCEEIQEVGDLPLPISNLVGKTYLFKVAIEKENYLYKHDTYKVLKIITNEDLISEFDPTHVSADSLNNRCAPEHSILSDAPEGSLMISGGSSLRSESLELTPAKRGGASLFNLEEAGDQNSVTKMMCFPKIKKEKVDKSG
ncbi:hypothetical protein Bca101_061971 [Brassica carinata]